MYSFHKILAWAYFILALLYFVFGTLIFFTALNPQDKTFIIALCGVFIGVMFLSYGYLHLNLSSNDSGLFREKVFIFFSLANVIIFYNLVLFSAYLFLIYVFSGHVGGSESWGLGMLGLFIIGLLVAATSLILGVSTYFKLSKKIVVALSFSPVVLYYLYFYIYIWLF